MPFTLINQNLNKISRGFQIKESMVFGPERISQLAGMNQRKATGTHKPLETPEGMVS